MRSLAVVVLLAACGEVGSTCEQDGTCAPGRPDATISGPDAASLDPDAAAPIRPLLAFSFDGHTANTGSATASAMLTPNGAAYVAGKFGSAFACGTYQYGQVAGMRSLLSTATDVTLAFWLKPYGELAAENVLDLGQRTTAPYGGVQLELAGGQLRLCASNTSEPLIGGGCGGITTPALNTWHHVLVRYDGAGLAGGQGGALRVYIDGTLTSTLPNEDSADPVFNAAMDDTMIVGGGDNGTQFDDLRIYDRVFADEEQCELIIGGTWSGTTCAIP